MHNNQFLNWHPHSDVKLVKYLNHGQINLLKYGTKADSGDFKIGSSKVIEIYTHIATTTFKDIKNPLD